MHWVRSFVRFHGLRHPCDLGAAEVEAFLQWLASDRGVAPSTHNQALSALLFLYREVLGVQLPWLNEIGRPKARERVPVVLSQSEVQRLLDVCIGVEGEVLHLLYGTGMRLMEALRLRVKDVDFERGEITVREGKGGKDRRVMLPQSMRAQLSARLLQTCALWRDDREHGRGGVHLPDALERKYPWAAMSWAGSGYGRRNGCRSIRRQAWCVAIISSSSACSVPCVAQRRPWAS